MKQFLLILVAILFMAGCSTLKKDQKNLGIIGARHPELLHNYCATTFPLKPTGSSFKPANNPDLSDSLQKLNKGIFELQQSNEDLRLAYQRALNSAEGDTACQSIIRTLNAKIEANTAQMEAYRKKITDLQRAYVPCAPDTLHDTIPDLAAVQVWTDKANGLQAQLNDALKKNAELEKANAKKMYIIFGMGMALLVGGFLAFKLRR